jgi:hypothetical protein
MRSSCNVFILGFFGVLISIGLVHVFFVLDYKFVYGEYLVSLMLACPIVFALISAGLVIGRAFFKSRLEREADAAEEDRV